MPEAAIVCKGGGFRSTTVREAAALTTSYVAADSIQIEGADHLELLVSFTKGSSDGCRIKIEFSDDDSSWFQEAYYTVSGSDNVYIVIFNKLEATADLAIPLDVANKYMKISALAITSGTGTSLSIVCVASNL